MCGQYLAMNLIQTNNPVCLTSWISSLNKHTSSVASFEGGFSCNDNSGCLVATVTFTPLSQFLLSSIALKAVSFRAAKLTFFPKLTHNYIASSSRNLYNTSSKKIVSPGSTKTFCTSEFQDLLAYKSAKLVSSFWQKGYRNGFLFVFALYIIQYKIVAQFRIENSKLYNVVVKKYLSKVNRHHPKI